MGGFSGHPPGVSAVMDKYHFPYIINALANGRKVAIIFPTAAIAYQAFFGAGHDSLEFTLVANKPGRLGVA
jgi:hypothetical protein